LQGLRGKVSFDEQQQIGDANLVHRFLMIIESIKPVDCVDGRLGQVRSTLCGRLSKPQAFRASHFLVPFSALFLSSSGH
jgi:hypothetical protein